MRTLVCRWPLLVVLALASCAHRTAAPAAAPAPAKLAGSLAVDSAGNIYASGRTVTKWDGGGNSTALHVGDPADAIVADEDYLYCAVNSEIRRFKLAGGQRVNFSQQVPRVDRVSSLDVAGAMLFVADAGANKIRMFDTTTGAAAGEFDVHAPQAVAVDPLGQIWVAHDHSVIQAFRADGYSGVTYGGLGDVSALTFGPGATLYAADAASGRVFVLDTGASPAQFVPVLNLGTEAGLCAVVADRQGNLITLQRRADGGGERLAKYGAADTTLMWELKR